MHSYHGKLNPRSAIPHSHQALALGCRAYLTEMRLTETRASERRNHSPFWRESVLGRLLAWVPGLAREPEGDVKKVHSCQAVLARGHPRPAASRGRSLL